MTSHILGLELGASDVLLIEDEDLMAALIHRYLENAPASHRPVDIKSLSSGWGLFESDLSSVKVAVVDILLPKVSGVDLIRDIRKRYPQIGIVPISGMATEPMKRQILELVPEMREIIAKPLRKTEFYSAFEQAWQHYLRYQPQPPGHPLPEEAREELWSVAKVSQQQPEVSVVKRKLVRKNTAG